MPMMSIEFFSCLHASDFIDNVNTYGAPVEERNAHFVLAKRERDKHIQIKARRKMTLCTCSTLDSCEIIDEKYGSEACESSLSELH